jgi:hypothetical protein
MARVSIFKGKPKAHTRVGVVFSLLAPLLLIGISNPQLAFASPTVSLPSTLTAGTSFTNARGTGTISISGYDAGASVQATVSVTSGNLKITTVTGLTAPTGYSSAAWTSDSSTEIAFYGLQTDVSNALNSLQYKASAVDAPATITVTTFAFGAAYNPSTGHFYEIVENSSVINWELARCKALYSNSDVSVSAGDSLLNTNRCTSSTTLTRRTLGGLRGYLANITSLAEHEFLYTKLQQTGWIGGADTDSEGTFIWMDGPEKGQPFWNSSSTVRNGTNVISGSARFNYFNAGEPNNASNEDFAEFGFGSAGAWNDCRNGCNRTRYVVEYGEDGDSLAGANGTISVNPRTAVTTETDTALSLSGSQYLESAQEAPFDIASGSTFTLEAWVRPTITNANQILLGKNNQYSLYISSNGSYGMNFYTTTTPLGTGGDTSIFRAGSVRTNEWQHVAVVRSGASVTGYVNGQALATFTNGSDVSSIKTGSSSFVVGGYSTLDQAFTGQIDQVRVWSSARTADELQSGMSTFIPSPQSNLIASYGFNELSGTKIFNNATSSTWETDLNLIGGSTTRAQIAETSTVDAYSVVTFRRSYLTSAGGWRVPSGVTRVTALAVAGGGAGGSRVGGGGGAGGLVLRSVQTLTPGRSETITVGAGGIGVANLAGKDGGNSFFGTLITAIGGGGGGASNEYGQRAGRPGGSGGGTGDASGNGTSTQTSAGSSDGKGFAGAVGQGGGNWSAGGGGGSVRAGYSGVDATKPGFGGDGTSLDISGSTICYAAGGGGGIYGASYSVRNNAGGCTTGGSTGGSGVAGGFTGLSASANTGSGGGGAGYVNNAAGSDLPGGTGGSGIIVIRWITATAPIFTGPSSDTLTAGMVETFTVSGSPISPLTRGYRWQVSTDTGTTWVNATTGTGFTSANYTTSTLETTTSGTRYRYRVVVTDSDTAGLSIVETSTAIVFLTINPRITITGSSVSLTQKYGETQTVTYTIANGTGTRTTAASPNNRTGITWSSVSGSAATLAIGAGLSVGTYYETLTVTDSVTATTTQMFSISISKADTITVTVNNPAALNYTGATASFTPSVSFSGLKSTDTATAPSVTITQTRSGATCAMGGTCAIGDRGPGGGIVFITPSTVSGNGRFFEAAPDAWYGANDLSTVGKFCIAGSNRDNTNEGATQFGIGWGETNTAIFRVNCTGGAVKLATDYRGGGFSNWFVPNKNELAEMAKIPSTVDLINVTNYWGYWSSTEDGSGPASTMSSLTSSSWTMGAVSKSESARNMVRPVRMFTSCHSVDSCTAFASTSMPTNAGTYRLTPSALSLDSGSLSNYQGVSYAAGVLTINKINQAPITIGQYDAFPGVSTYPLNVYGGTGTGVMRRTLTSAGTANCALTNMIFITASTSGICTVSVTKAADFNYNLQSATATIYWIPFINRYTSSGPTTPTDLGLSGSTGYERRSYETFTVLSFANGSGTAVTSVAKNTVMRIIGTGFDTNDATTEVIVGFFSIPRSSLVFDTTNPLANFVQFTLPNSSDLDLGANDVAMKSRKGWAFAPGLLTVTG